MNTAVTLSANARATEGARLITRSEMLLIARLHNLFVTKSTIRRWANEQGFPMVVGVGGRNLLYLQAEFVAFIRSRVRRMQEAK